MRCVHLLQLGELLADPPHHGVVLGLLPEHDGRLGDLRLELGYRAGTGVQRNMPKLGSQMNRASPTHLQRGYCVCNDSHVIRPQIQPLQQIEDGVNPAILDSNQPSVFNRKDELPLPDLVAP